MKVLDQVIKEVKGINPMNEQMEIKSRHERIREKFGLYHGKGKRKKKYKKKK